MTTYTLGVFDDLAVDYILFYVENIDRSRAWFVNGYGFGIGAPGTPVDTDKIHSLFLDQGQIRLVLRQPLVADHPVVAYLAAHGDGVADIGLRVDDAAVAFTERVRRGARPVSPPIRHNDTVTTSILAFGDVTHTFVERNAEQDLPRHTGTGLGKVDHFAVCVEPGKMGETIEFYRQVLDFDLTMSERIVAGEQAMFVNAVQSRSREFTLTLIESDSTAEASHVDDFVKSHHGAGVQHIAFTTDDILTSVDHIRARGIEFLHTPDTYYSMLADRISTPISTPQPSHTIEQIRERDVLVDADQDGPLYQIFARSVHPRNTIFLEIIERVGARTFGSSNIKSLYEAVELSRSRTVDTARNADERRSE